MPKLSAELPFEINRPGALEKKLQLTIQKIAPPWLSLNHSSYPLEVKPYRLPCGPERRSCTSASGTSIDSLTISGNGNIYLGGNDGMGAVWKLLPNGTVEAITGTAAVTYDLSVIPNPATKVQLADVQDLLSGPTAASSFVEKN